MNHQQSTNPNAALFFAGLAFGAVMAALFTPKTGVQLREELRNQSRRTADQLKKAGQDLNERKENVKKAVKKSDDTNKPDDLASM